MPQDERELRLRELAVADVEVGPADPAGVDADPHLAGPQRRPRQIGRAQRRSRSVQDHRPHRLHRAATHEEKSPQVLPEADVYPGKDVP